MTTRYDLCVAREVNGKTYFTKIGVMFPMNGKDGFSISLEALPLQQIGRDGKLECRLVAFPPKQDDRAPARGNGRSNRDELNDEIPW